MTDTLKTQGVVKLIKGNQTGGFSLYLMDGVRYGMYKGIANCSTGDIVEIEYTLSEDGKWKNIQNIKVTGKAPTPEFKPASSFKKEMNVEGMLMRYVVDWAIANKDTYPGTPDKALMVSAVEVGQAYLILKNTIEGKNEGSNSNNQ